MSEIFLRNFDRYDDVRQFHSTTGQLGSRAADSAQKIAGVFAMTEGQPVAVYRDGGELVVQLEERQMPITALAKAQLRSSRGKRIVEISLNGEILMSIPFDEAKTPIAGFDFTPLVEDEHFDFALYLSNVVNNPARAARMFCS